MAQKVLRTSSNYVIQSGGNVTVSSTPSGTITIDTGIAGTTVVTGNLTVQGTTTTVDSTVVNIEDNVITLNYGETGAGVTLINAGIEIDRGTQPKASVYWNETNTRWELRSNASTPTYATVKVGSIVLNTGSTVNTIDNDTTLAADSATALPTQHAVKTYVDTTFSASANTIYQGNSSVTVHDTGTGYVESTIDGTVIANLNSSGFQVDVVSSRSTNGNLTLTANGTGEVVIDKALAMPYLGSTPVAAGFTNKIYTNTPGSGGSGVFFVNTTYSDELVSKTKAIVYGIIF